MIPAIQAWPARVRLGAADSCSSCPSGASRRAPSRTTGPSASKAGRITAAGPRATLRRRPPADHPAPPRRSSGSPGVSSFPRGVNAHNHSFQSLLRGLGDDLDFMGMARPCSLSFLAAARRPGNRDRRGLRLRRDAAPRHHDGRGLLLRPGAVATRTRRRPSGRRSASGSGLVLARAFYDWSGAPPEYRETVDEATAPLPGADGRGTRPIRR